MTSCCNKTTLRYVTTGLACITFSLATSLAMAKEIVATSMPPAADLRYAISAKLSGFTISGNATVKWFQDSKTYSILADTHAMIVGKILDARSDGSIGRYGITPDRFYEKALRKPAATSTFDRDKMEIRFTQSDNHYPITGGEQDRTSIVWHLVSVARANNKTFQPGSVWEYFVVGPRDAEPWRFTVVKNEQLDLPMGTLDTVHVFRDAPPDAAGQKLDIWLAPAQNWYPVRIRFTEPDGDFVDQKVESITPR